MITKKGNKDIKNSTKCSICDNDYIDNDVNVMDHCHIIIKYRGSVHKDCNINVKLNRKIPVVFHNLKSYDSHIVMQVLGKFSFQINTIPNGLEKYTSINNQLSIKLFIR